MGRDRARAPDGRAGRRGCCGVGFRPGLVAGRGAPGRGRRPRSGAPRGQLSLIYPSAVVALHGRTGSDEVFIGISSFTRRLDVLRLDLTGRRGGAATALPTGAAEPVAGFIAERRHGTSADGTSVPMTVVRRADLPDGTATDPAVRLRRVRHPGAAHVLRAVRRLGAGRRGAGGGQPARRRGVRRRVARGRHEGGQAAGLRRSVRLRRTADRRRHHHRATSWPCTAGPTADCWSARR